MSDSAWSFYLFDTVLNTTAGTGQITECTQMTGRQLKFSLTEGATLSFSLPGSHQDTPLYQAGKTDIIAFRGNRAMQRFLITERSISWEGGISTCSYNTMSYRSQLDRWMIHDDAVRDFPLPPSLTPVEQTLMAWTLIHEAESRANEEWNLTRGTLPDTSVLRLRQNPGADPGDSSHGFDSGTKIGEAVASIADADDGFEWDIEPDPANPNTALVFNTWNAGFRKQHGGSLSTFVLDAGGSVASFTWKESMSEYGNVIRVVGKPETFANYEGASGPLAWRDLSSDSPFGRYERPISVDANTQVGVDEAADAEILKQSKGDPDWEVTLSPGRYDPDVCHVGDYLRFVGTIAPLGDLDLPKRVHEINISLTDEGTETVTMSIGRPPSTYFTRQRSLARRITKLERR